MAKAKDTTAADTAARQALDAAVQAAQLEVSAGPAAEDPAARLARVEADRARVRERARRVAEAVDRHNAGLAPIEYETEP